MYNKRDFKACDARETAVYSVVNEDFEGEYNAKITLLDDSYARQTPKEPLPKQENHFKRGILRLLADRQTAAYLWYVRIWMARQTPKEPLKMFFSNIREYLPPVPTEDN